MLYEADHIETAPDREGAEREAIVFELRPLDAVIEVVEGPFETRTVRSLDELRTAAMEAAAAPASFPSSTVRTVYQRSRDVREYVLARASGHCEGCKTTAPFLRKNGTPYLEPHHIRRVSDGGPDDPAFVIALCPNCHRRVHAGEDGEDYNEKLLTSMTAIEPN